LHALEEENRRLKQIVAAVVALRMLDSNAPQRRRDIRPVERKLPACVGWQC
jgi:hypothetical protein